VEGGGIAELRSNGVVVDVGVCHREAAELNAPYLKRIHTGLPWVIAKWAMTLDGKIASRTGKSHWISSLASRRMVHHLRGRMDAIMVGRQTVLADDPLLTARPAGPRTALRIAVTSTADLPLDRQLVRTAREIPVLIAAANSAPEENVQSLREAGCEVWLGPANRSDFLHQLLRELGTRGFTNVLVEGGATLLGNLIDARLVDELHVFIAPKILGGADAVAAVGGRGVDELTEACSLAGVSYELLDGDVHAWGRLATDDSRLKTSS
jgi:diaminohydroxyphosphoribosylaminopyrimidine deaminase/5-amino-6-(5-phosphoribosylamino)uracil reductase